MEVHFTENFSYATLFLLLNERKHKRAFEPFMVLNFSSQFQVRKMKKELKKDLGVDKCKQQ